MMKRSDTIICHIKDCYLKAKEVGYPENFLVSGYWGGIQKRIGEAIGHFKSRKSAVRWCQKGMNTGFDHRSFAERSLVGSKVRRLECLFPDFHLKWRGWLGESSYSDVSSIIEFEGGRYSAIFLLHLYFYLRIAHVFYSEIKPDRVMEIGGGYGALARIFKSMVPDLAYIIVDLPESLFFAYCFLSLNFPNAKIKYVTKKSKADLDAFDFILVPVQLCESIRGEEFDVVINTGSLQEMPSVTVAFWMGFIQDVVSAKAFYSFNYFLLNKEKCLECSGKEANSSCLILDPWWEVKYFGINPEIIKERRQSWLEVCLKRLDHRDAEKAGERGAALFQMAKRSRRNSNEWFQSLWMAIWHAPRKEYLAEMLVGLSESFSQSDEFRYYADRMR